jgi:hypothetical protein
MKRARKPRRTQSNRQLVATAEQRRRVVELRLRGMTFEAIGAAIGRDASSAHRAYYGALAAIPERVASEERKAMLERLELLRRNAWTLYKRDPAAALAVLLRIEERHARLLGLDPKPAAVEVNMLGSDGGAISIALARDIARDIEAAANLTPEPPPLDALALPAPDRLAADVEPMSITEARRRAALGDEGDVGASDARPPTGRPSSLKTTMEGARMQREFLQTLRTMRPR